MRFARGRSILPNWKNLTAALLSAILLIGAFPDFEYWFLAWFALVPLLWAVEREKASVVRSFVLGWLFGTVFFFGTCWWLTYAPIHYAGFPPWLAYSGMVFVAAMAGLFPAIFAAVLSLLLRRFGSLAFLAAPFVWVFTEFLRYWVTGNNWDAIGYSQAFSSSSWGLGAASVGGIYLTGFNVIFASAFISFGIVAARRRKKAGDSFSLQNRLALVAFGTYLSPFVGFILFLADPTVRAIYRRPNHASLGVRFAAGLTVVIPIGFSFFVFWNSTQPRFSTGIFSPDQTSAYLVAVQPNVAMSGVNQTRLEHLRNRHIELADSAFENNLQKYVDENARIHDGMVSEYGMDADFYKGFYREQYKKKPKVVVFPESPMNFMYNDDREFQQFIGDFARRNNVRVLFNSAEPDKGTTKYFNSAVMVGPDGREVAEYDKIYLLPFGEAVPPMLEGIVPGFVGNFSYGREYDLLPVGDAKAGVMICFESHFGQLSRRYVQDGADVIIEMTNDGYLGPTPVLRQHLANAVFRAVETNRPVLRVTNVGITAYINERGEVLDAAPPYQEDTRVWSVSKSDGSQTFYVKYGDWFAWLCTIVTIGLLSVCVAKRKRNET